MHPFNFSCTVENAKQEHFIVTIINYELHEIHREWIRARTQMQEEKIIFINNNNINKTNKTTP